MSGVADISGVLIINEALVTISLDGWPARATEPEKSRRDYLQARVARSNERRASRSELMRAERSRVFAPTTLFSRLVIY